MIRHFTHTLLLVCGLSFSGFGQKYFGNEWIKYDQHYLKIPISETGYYQISGAELQAAGWNISEIRSGALQLFRRGKEVQIVVSAPATDLISEKDWIRFHAEKNSGAADSLLYAPNPVPNPHYSLYSDTAAYFLTWNNALFEGKRISKNAESEAQTDFHFQETNKVFSSHYAPGTFYPPGSNFTDGTTLSEYDQNEGWTGEPFKAGKPAKFAVETDNIFLESGLQMHLQIGITSWDAGEQQVEFLFKKIKKQIHIEGNSFQKLDFAIPFSELDSDNALIITMNAQNQNRISVSYLQLKYAQKGKRPVELIRKVPAFIPRKFPKWTVTDIDYLIITHKNLRQLQTGRDPVQAYADYRASPEGGSYRPLILDIAAIFEEFNFGDCSPQAIKNAISWLQTQTHLKFVFLVGQSIDPQKARKLPDQVNADMIPNAGWPGSDLLLVTDFESPETGPAIGRLNANRPEEVWDYLQKVKTMEAQSPAAPWRKRILHLSGGRSRDELAVFKGYVHDFESKLVKSAAGLSVKTLAKVTDDPVEKIPAENEVNKGVALMTIFGHSAPDLTDIDIGYASDPARGYENSPYLPAVIVNGCASGSIFYSDQTLSSDWIFTPKHGAVLFLAHTFNGVSTALKRYTGFIYETVADSNFTDAPFGQIIREAIKRNIVNGANIFDRATMQQMVLHGDPAIRIFSNLPADIEIDSTIHEPEKPTSFLVNIDDRQLRNGDNVAQNAVLTILTTDTNRCIAQTDTAGMAIWLKPFCQNCAEMRVSLHNANWVLQQDGICALKVALPVDLQPGEYQLTVRIRNSKPAETPDYQVLFRILQEKRISSIDVSPNPGTEAIRVKIQLEGLKSDNATAEITFYALTGKTILHRNLALQIGLNEYFWQPINLPTGIYLYKIYIKDQSIPVSISTATRLSGRLLWIR